MSLGMKMVIWWGIILFATFVVGFTLVTVEINSEPVWAIFGAEAIGGCFMGLAYAAGRGDA